MTFMAPSPAGVDVPLLETHGRPSWRHPLFESLFEPLALPGGDWISFFFPIDVETLTHSFNITSCGEGVSSNFSSRNTKKQTLLKTHQTARGCRFFHGFFPWLCTSSGLFPNFKPALLARGELCLKANCVGTGSDGETGSKMKDMARWTVVVLSNNSNSGSNMYQDDLNISELFNTLYKHSKKWSTNRSEQSSIWSWAMRRCKISRELAQTSAKFFKMSHGPNKATVKSWTWRAVHWSSIRTCREFLLVANHCRPQTETSAFELSFFSNRDGSFGLIR